MNKQEQRIAIAEACGFNINRIDRNEDDEIKFIWCNKYPEGWKGPDIRPWIPEFSTDLNAMHEAEKVLENRLHASGDTITRYYRNLTKLMPSTPYIGYHDIDYGCINATAAQRAEAFLKTLNLWK